MFCKNCGGQLVEGTKFCSVCGCPIEVVAPVSVEPTPIQVSTEVVQQPVQPLVEPVIQQPVVNQSVMQQPIMQQSIENQLPGQQPMGINNNFRQPEMHNQQKKKKDMLLFIIIAIIGIAVIAVPIILNMNKDKKEDDTSKGNNDTNNGENTNNKGNINNTTKEVEYDGFVFQIPKNYNTSIASDGLTIQADTWFAMIETETGSYDYFKNATDYLKSYMAASGFTVGEVKIKTFNGVEFLTAEIAQDELEMILAYAKLTDNEVAVIVVANYSYTVDETLLNNIAPIIKSATVSTGTQGL